MSELGVTSQMNTLNKRPISVSLIGVLFFAAGVVGVVYHATEFNARGPLKPDELLVLAVRLLAIIGAVFLFRAHNWARWLLVVWMAFHVVLSSFHSPVKLVVHGILLIVVIYILFRRPASAYFQQRLNPAEKLTTKASGTSLLRSSIDSSARVFPTRRLRKTFCKMFT